MEESMAKLEQETKELEHQKEMEALKLKQQAKQEAAMREQLDQTAKAEINARKYETKMIHLRNEATEKLFN